MDRKGYGSHLSDAGLVDLEPFSPTLDSPVPGLKPRSQKRNSSSGSSPSSSSSASASAQERSQNYVLRSTDEDDVIAGDKFEYDWPLDENTVEDPTNGLRWLKVRSHENPATLYKTYPCVIGGNTASGHKVYIARCVVQDPDGKERYAFGGATSEYAFFSTTDDRVVEYDDRWQVLLAPPNGYAFGWSMATHLSSWAYPLTLDPQTQDPVFAAHYLKFGTTFVGMSFRGRAVFVHQGLNVEMGKHHSILCMVPESKIPPPGTLDTGDWPYDKKATFSTNNLRRKSNDMSSSLVTKPGKKPRRATISELTGVTPVSDVVFKPLEAFSPVPAFRDQPAFAPRNALSSDPVDATPPELRKKRLSMQLGISFDPSSSSASQDTNAESATRCKEMDGLEFHRRNFMN